MRRHSEDRRIGMYAVYLSLRRAQMTDALVELLISTIHKIAVRGERTVAARILKDIQKISGKANLLADIAEAAMAGPEDTVANVIFPVASPAKLKTLIRERKAKGEWNIQVFQATRRSYANHYRPMLPKILSVLEFKSNNRSHRPVLTAFITQRQLRMI